jgi:hypothetical protein
MLGFQSQDLIVELLRKALSLVGKVVQVFYFLDCLSNFSSQALVYAVLVALLFAPDVYFLSEVLVLGLKIVKNYVGLIKLVFELLDPVLILSHFGSGWSDGL